ncbi:hypothetical protein [Ekhidna sp.]|uniref:hypothetical protein n=1 Tax=Ekhidna sp. TaxID=2608089 RepID=UPI003516826C
MKPILTTIFILILILTFCSRLHAQESDTLKAETILRLENPYKKNRTKWLNENGFNTSTYSWDDPTINLYLNQAVKRRSKANVIGIVGGSILVLGLAANAMGRLVESINDSNPDDPYQVMKGPYYIGGAMIVTSVGLSLDSLAKLKKAKNERERKFK